MRASKDDHHYSAGSKQSGVPWWYTVSCAQTGTAVVRCKNASPNSLGACASVIARFLRVVAQHGSSDLERLLGDAPFVESMETVTEHAPMSFGATPVWADRSLRAGIELDELVRRGRRMLIAEAALHGARPHRQSARPKRPAGDVSPIDQVTPHRRWLRHDRAAFLPH